MTRGKALRPAVLAAIVAVAAPGCNCTKRWSEAPARVSDPVAKQAAPVPANPVVPYDAGAQGEERPASPEPVLGVTYHVGPGRKLAHLRDVAPLLRPGDLVLVDGDATYAEDVRFTESGEAGRRITIRGVRANGRRPVIHGTVSAVELAGDHYVMEGFEITGGSSRCVFHHAHDVTIRDTVVHACPSHGILGADDDSGSLTLEYVEVYDAGSGEMKHPIYMSTDPHAHPGAVFRMRHCYVHDGHGGNAVKSRAERNEIYYNWIEGATYDELGLYGPEDSDTANVRADSDVVGNVIRKTTPGWYVARIGGDGSGQSWGRYRFVNNTVLLSPGAAGVFRITFGIDSLELYNNVFYKVGGGGLLLMKDGGEWRSGRPIIAGSNNVVPPGSTLACSIPGTLVDADPGFADVSSNDVHLRAGSPLNRAGCPDPKSPPGHPFPAPLLAPRYLPPMRTVEAPGTAKVRNVMGNIGIGAFDG